MSQNANNKTELNPEAMQPVTGGSTYPSCSGNTSYKCDHSSARNMTYLGEDDKEEGGRILRRYRCNVCWKSIWLDLCPAGGVTGSW